MAGVRNGWSQNNLRGKTGKICWQRDYRGTAGDGRRIRERKLSKIPPWFLTSTTGHGGRYMKHWNCVRFGRRGQGRWEDQKGQLIKNQKDTNYQYQKWKKGHHYRQYIPWKHNKGIHYKQIYTKKFNNIHGMYKFLKDVNHQRSLRNRKP